MTVVEPTLAQPEAPPVTRQRRRLLPAPLRNPWGKPRFLVLSTWLYLAWALLPVGVALLFSFNNGRSRSVWQGFSLRWWTGDQLEELLLKCGATRVSVSEPTTSSC